MEMTMRQNTKASRFTILGLSVATAALIALGGCKKADEDGTTQSPVGSVYNPPVGVVDDSAGFYVRAIANAEAPMVIHAGNPNQYNETGSYDISRTECRINSTSDPIATRDIMCYAEAEELDLYYWGISLQYNVPSTMCTYVRFTPYYFWMKPAGFGPSNSAYSVNATGTINPTENAGADGSYCAFDYTAEKGPNCCEGNYTLTKTVWNPQTMMFDPPAATPANWGGKMSDCLGGPATLTQKKSLTGWPLPDFYYVGGKGINLSYEVKAPMDLLMGSNLHAANYFNSSDFMDNTTWPRSFNPASAVVTTPPSYPPASVTLATQTSARAMPFFELSCLNRNNDVKARIRFMVRSWDVENMARINYAATAGYNSFFPDDILHDFGIWEDIRNALLGTWEQGFPGLYY
jgi:hypothetical protein